MIHQHAILYPGSQRGQTQSTEFRSLHTFNFGDYYEQHRQPVGTLLAVNEETLKENTARTWTAKQDQCVILIPVIGRLQLVDDTSSVLEADAGEMIVYTLPANGKYAVRNPYGKELISFIHLIFKAEDVHREPAMLIGFELHESRNKMNALMPGLPGGAIISLGKFDGRTDVTYPLRHPGKVVFAFVIEGVFEVEGRLLEYRDGLTMTGVEVVEFEALSNDAVLLLVEH